jgi:hypothetical protein
MTIKTKTTTLHILKGCLLLFAAAIIACGSEPVEGVDYSVVTVDSSLMANQKAEESEVTIEGTVHRSDMNMGAAFTITMYMDSFGVDYNQKHYTLKSNDELKKMIEQSGGASLDGKVALASDDETTIERMEEVLEIMAKHGITGYSLVE